MPTYQIEMLWNCTHCGSQNKGRYKECQECTNPKDGTEEYYMPGDTSKSAAVKDKQLLKWAKAGPDWECKYCDSHQRKSNGECAQCGAPEGEGESIDKNVDGCKSSCDDFPEYGKRRKAAKITVQDLHDTLKKQESTKKSFLKKHYKKIGIGAGIAVLIGLLLFFLFRTRIVDAQVSSVYWAHTVMVDRYQVYSDRGFDPPGDAFDRRAKGMRHHHYIQVPDGFRTVSYTVQEQCGQTCSTTPRVCTPNKNGFATCTGGNRVCSPKYCTRTKYRKEQKYRQKSVERMYYSWNVWRWGHNRNVADQGNTFEITWPSKKRIGLNESVSGRERERSKKKAEYSVKLVDDDGDEHEYKPGGIDEFKKFEIGSRHKLKVSVAGGVSIVKEKDDEKN
jgi:hypothetical protein